MEHYGDVKTTNRDKLEEIKNWCNKASCGNVLFDASAGMRFLSYSMRLIDLVDVLEEDRNSLYETIGLLYKEKEQTENMIYKQDRKIEFLFDALKAIATPGEYKLVMQEIKSLRETSQED